MKNERHEAHRVSGSIRETGTRREKPDFREFIAENAANACYGIISALVLAHDPFGWLRRARFKGRMPRVAPVHADCGIHAFASARNDQRSEK